MKVRYLLALALLICGSLLATCSPSAGSDEPQPPEIAYGQDVCDACGMILDEPKFAAATLLADGETRKFDDIGDMFVYHMDHPDQQVQAWFVHDHGGEKWLRAEKAFFVMSDSIATPMGHGLAAFADQAAAEAFAAQLGGQALNFDEARAQIHVKVHG